MKQLYSLLAFCLFSLSSFAQQVIWKIGEADDKASEFCLAPNNYKAFLENDFGFEDRFFVVGHSEAAKDFPYVLPGPKDIWGGTWSTAGWRTHDANILFHIQKLARKAKATLVVDLVDVHPSGAVVKVKVNGKEQRFELKGASLRSVEGDYTDSREIELRMELNSHDLSMGDNLVALSVLEGSWVVFDQVRLEGEGLQLTPSEQTTHLLAVKAAEYDLKGRKQQRRRTPADYVDTGIGSAHSRWMIAPGPWMPFGMVKLSPDNQNRGWQAGYQPTFETLACMSHIHEWTMAGLGMMPTNGPLQIKVGDESRPDEGYRSRIDKTTEQTPLGYYGVRLTDTDILLEATATMRASLQRYTFPSTTDGRVMIDLHIEAEYDYQLKEVEVRQVSDSRIEGRMHQYSPGVWSNDADQDYNLCFVMEFSEPILRTGCWMNDSVFYRSELKGADLRDAGMFVEFDTKWNPVVSVRTGISYVSIDNAALNLKTEITEPFAWDFAAVVNHQHQAWNDILGRVEIETDDVKEKVRFYTNLYRSMCRNCFSDVNGDWVGPDEKVRRFADPQKEYALGCDAFWNTFWNLNQVWNLITPEWASRWVHSQLALYDACGWLAKGPAGMEYIPVMVGEHEIPQMVSAWQMGIRDFDGQKALEAMVHQQTTPATRIHGGFTGNRDLQHYLKHRYVPADKGRFSNTLEYSFDDWTVAQMALSIGNDSIYRLFSERGTWWKNAINPENGYAHMRDSLGRFVPDFDPFRSGNNSQYVEGNAWQLSYFVPQDLLALVDILGKDAFVERLNWGFEASEPWRYNAPNDQYWNYPVCQGNQQSMHFSFLFNWAGEPWLTQKWTRSIIDRYYGYGKANAYLGDEDQGQMSAWFVMAAMGLFQTEGGCSKEPFYELSTPLYERITIHLGGRYGRGKKFVIEAPGAPKNRYIKSVVLNGKPLNGFRFPASQLLKGGRMVIETSALPCK